MITIKNREQINIMTEANAIVKECLALLKSNIKEGITTRELDSIANKFILGNGAKPSFLGYGGFPASICTSIDDMVIHGIPNDVPLKNGEIISVDVGAEINGMHGDAARTFAVGDISDEKQKLIDVTQQSFFEGIKFFKEGCRLGDIGSAIQSYAESYGYGVVREYVGHGIGYKMHEDPQVPNFGEKGHGLRITNGMTLAIEPMINMGTSKIKLLKDNWGVVTLDGKPSAHYENTVALIDGELLVLTL